MNLHLDDTADDAAIPLTPLDRAGFASWREQASPRQRLWTEQVGFSGEAGTRCLLPGEDGRLEQVVCGVGNLGSPWSYGDLPARLPAGAYRLSSPLPTPSTLALD